MKRVNPTHARLRRLEAQSRSLNRDRTIGPLLVFLVFLAGVVLLLLWKFDAI